MVFWLWTLVSTLALYGLDKNVLGLGNVFWAIAFGGCTVGAGVALYREIRQKRENERLKLRSDQRKHEELVENDHLTHGKLDSLGGVVANVGENVRALLGTTLRELAREALALAEGIEQLLATSLEEYREPDPPYVRPSPSIRDTQLVNAYMVQYGERVQRLRDECAAKGVREPTLDAVYDRPTGNQSLHSIVNGLRKLSETLAALNGGQAKRVSVDCTTDTIRDPLRAILGITNRGALDEFQVQVIAWGANNELHRTTAVTLKWVKGGGETLKIAPGITEYLEIVEIEHSLSGFPFRNEKGELPRGMVELKGRWLRSSEAATYFAPKDFRARVWSLQIVISATSCAVPHQQGVRVHLFTRFEDDPSGKPTPGWEPERPIVRLSLFDITPSTPDSEAPPS